MRSWRIKHVSINVRSCLSMLDFDSDRSKSARNDIVYSSSSSGSKTLNAALGCSSSDQFHPGSSTIATITDSRPRSRIVGIYRRMRIGCSKYTMKSKGLTLSANPVGHRKRVGHGINSYAAAHGQRERVLLCSLGMTAHARPAGESTRSSTSAQHGTKVKRAQVHW